jgi:hypothetical protein
MHNGGLDPELEIMDCVAPNNAEIAAIAPAVSEGGGGSD